MLIVFTVFIVIFIGFVCEFRKSVKLIYKYLITIQYKRTVDNTYTMFPLNINEIDTMIHQMNPQNYRHFGVLLG